MATFADLGPWKGNSQPDRTWFKNKKIIEILWKENIHSVNQPQETAQCWKSLILKIFFRLNNWSK